MTRSTNVAVPAPHGITHQGKPIQPESLHDPVAARLHSLDSIVAARGPIALTMPTLVYWGADDPLAILAQGLALFDLIREHSPRAHMHIINHAGHFNYREYPEEWNRVVTNFVQCNL